MVVIRVPATTANLGPGFDCLGLALSLYARFTFEKKEQGLLIKGCEPAYANEDNLVYRAYLSTLSEYRVKPQGLTLTIQSDIPVSRGLGSSAACIVGGILGASTLYDLNLSQDAVFALATRLEGHPDNVAPAIFGGLRVSILEEGWPYSLPSPLFPGLRFLALVPDFPLETKKARDALSPMVSLKKAVYNLSRTAFLLKALENGQEDALRLGAGDRLHQEARLNLIKDGQALKESLEEQGAMAVFVSGAGPSLMCVYQDPLFERKAQAITQTRFPRFTVLPLLPCMQGAKEERNNQE